MARSKSKEVGTCASRKPAKTMARAKEAQSQDQEGSKSRDPWTFVDRQETAAGVRSFTSVNDPKSSSEPTLKSQLVAHFAERPVESCKSRTTSQGAAEPVKPCEEEDNIAIPTPIQATLPCKIVAADGREAYIYAPISGFEHLFQVPDGSHEASSRSSRASDAPQAASQPQQTHVPGTPQPDSACTGSRQLRNRDARQSSVASKKKNVPTPSQKKFLKRTRSVAQGLSQPHNGHDCSDAEDRASNGDDEADETPVVTEDSKTFRIGDIEALKLFFRHRIDELTMKPVRSMVTSWVKQLEPKRKGGYGPYHKMLPSEAAEDATPPWWPESVPYVEPAHLDKDGLLTLAVEIMLQHRDMPVDDLKRQRPWTHKLRRVAEVEVEMTPAEQYSSSRNPAFSAAMKKRAEEEILPSLFDVSQSYEDHVNHYLLWTYKDMRKAPQGRTITWQFIPRPSKLLSRVKRPRPALRIKEEPKEPAVECIDDDSSGNETVPDDTMYKLAAKIIRIEEAKAARRKVRAANARTAIMQAASSERPVEPPAAVPVLSKDKPEPVTPQHTEVLQSKDVNTDISPSFDQSLTHLRLQDDKGGDRISDANTDHQTTQSEATERSLVMSGQQAQPTRPIIQLLASPMPYPATVRCAEDEAKPSILTSCKSEALPLDEATRYHAHHAGYGNETFQPMSGPGSFANAGPSAFTPLVTQNFVDPHQISLFQNTFPFQISHSYGTDMGVNNMSYTYGPDSMFTPMDVTMSGTSSQANSSFHGLPYEFSGSQR